MWRGSRWGVLVLVALLAAGPAGLSVGPARAAAQTLHLGYSTWVGYGPLFLARDNRYFDEAGVNVELTNIEDPKLRFAALAAGKLDGLVTTLDTLSLYWKPNLQFQAVLGLDDSKGGDGIVSSDAIKTVKDLRGKRVAFNEGSVSHFFLSVLLRQNGMTEKDVRAINLRQDDAGAAFLAGKVDAAVTWEPWLTRAKQKAGSHILVDSSKTPGLIVDVMVIRRDVLKAHPGAVRAAVLGWYKAVDYWKKNPADADRIMAKAVGGWLKDVKTFQETLDGVRYYDEAINREYMAPGGQIWVTAQNAIDIWSSLGKIETKEAAGDIVNNSFVMAK
ncbi:MAG TPA: ABC transporter substrate-binding protein [bacterium]|nr:ABC transporter substrate-binding protein [bacterium]